MSNDYFQFKQFIVKQSGASMKVCTDSCVLGAYAKHARPQQILDIGTGTGLLSLMLAQKYPDAKITALEPDAASFQQARVNLGQSSWSDNFNLLPHRIQDFIYESSDQFDLIICNPPFYPAQKNKPELNQAAHSFQLPTSEIVKAINKLLSFNGLAYILYPPHQTKELQKMSTAAGLHLQEKLYIKNTKLVDYFRVVAVIGKKNQATIAKELVIHENGKYSVDFTELMKDYYLFL